MKALERIAPRWVPVTIVLTASLVVLACGERKPDAPSTSQSTSHSASAQSASALPTPAFSMDGASGSDSTVLRLAAATDTALAGTPVRLSVAHVQSVMSDRGFWIGVWGQQVYVFQTASRPVPVQDGDAYTVIGTVRVAPHSAQGAPRGMAPIDIEAMHAQHVYIAADSVAASAR